MYLFFYDTLVSWAGETAVITSCLWLVGINFLIELIINIVLCPTVARIIKKKSNVIAHFKGIVPVLALYLY
jgi:nitrogen fixation/metabolism regulation signal transduction histidine kinase